MLYNCALNALGSILDVTYGKLTENEYSKEGKRAFDNNFMSKVYEKDFEVIYKELDECPEEKKQSKSCGRNFDGCRIGFDAGGSDRKVSAVVNGESIYSEEVVWFPKLNSDPEYHYQGILEAMKTAASKMPRVDAIGVSSAGVYIDNKIMVASLFIKVSDEVEIVGLSAERKKTVVTGVEMFRKLLDQAEAGDNIGVLLRGVDRKDIERGQVISKPGTINPHTKFKSEVYVLTKEEGGRHTPFFNGYRPQFYFRTTDVTGVIDLPAGVEMVMPGDNVSMTIELITPIAIEKGLRFAIREGGRTVGSGVVSDIIA